MALVSKPFTWTVGATIVASEHNSNFDTIYSDYNGNITNANISGSAAISDSKLAQITSASKVSGAALSGLSSIPTGAGAVPLKNGGTGQDLSTNNQGDIYYDGGTNGFTRLTPGTAGQVLSTGGASANPAWASLVGAPASQSFESSILAATNGFVVGFATGGAANCTMTALTDAANPPTTTAQKGTFTFVGGGPNAFVPIGFIVKKGDYYKVTNSTAGGGTLNFVPIGN